MSNRLKHTITTVSACLLLGLFLYTASSKLLNLAGFERVLRKSPLITSVAPLLSVLIPVAETGIATLLFVPNWRRAGFASSFYLLVVFTLYIGYMLLFMPNLPCSCGGVLQKLGWTGHLLLNVFFILLSGVGYSLLTSNHIAFPINSFLRKKQEMLKTCRNE